MISETPFEFESFFEDRGWLEPGVKWSYGKESGIFKPKISIGRHRINPLFKRDQVIDAIKWKRIQKAINNKELPSEEMMALLRIRSRLEWREKKVATIEASIIAEAILRNYGDRILTTLGFSGNKLKNLKDELTFSTLLNIVLPLTLSKSRSAKLQDKIDAVNVLRKIRNDLVHGIISESEIDDKNVRAGIESTLKLVEFIREKLGHK